MTHALDLAWTMAEDRGRGSLDAHLRRLLKQYDLDATSFSARDSPRIRGRGYPDWTIVGRHRIEWWELKSQAGLMSLDQLAWQWAIEQAGGVYKIRRPLDLLSGRIEAELAAIAGVS